MEGKRSEASEGQERIVAGREASTAFSGSKKGKAPQELWEPYCQAGQSWGKRVYIFASPMNCHFQPICSHCYQVARSRHCCLMACGKQEGRKEPQLHSRVSKGRKCEWQLHCWHLPWKKKAVPPTCAVFISCRPTSTTPRCTVTALIPSYSGASLQGNIPVSASVTSNKTSP